MEQWQSTPQAGDRIQRQNMLDEIKTNLIAVIRDYEDLPPFNEGELILEAEKLFTGDIVPSRKDWERLIRLLDELATVKEQGRMYSGFIQDLSDSLGVSDLEQIRDFLDYIQTLPPQEPSVSLKLNRPDMYGVTGVAATSSNEWSQAHITWSLTSNYLNVATGELTGDRSGSEDVSDYAVEITAGSHSEILNITPTGSLNHTFPLNWQDWFPSGELDDVWVKAAITTTDKRGNTSYASTRAKYPSYVHIPRGVDYYEVQGQKDGGGWLTIGKTTDTAYTWSVPRQNGNYQWRVRAVDKNKQTTSWSYTPTQFIRFVPDAPPAPAVSVSTTLNQATVTWTAAARADYYEVWHGGESWAKDHTVSGGSTYWKKVDAGATRKVVLGDGYGQGSTHTFYVRAVNEGGSSKGSRRATFKRKVLKKVSYKPEEYRIWRGEYTYKNYWGTTTKNKSHWRSTNRLYQGGWKEIVRSRHPRYPGWDARGGGSYKAWGLQEWGNHMSFMFLDYTRMRNLLRNKEIAKVTITVSRSDTTKGERHHGWPEAKPLYLYNHNKDANMKAPETHSFYRADGTTVTKDTQQKLDNVSFDRGETESIANGLSKRLIQNIVDGKMKGLGIVRFYGNYFNSPLDVGDKAYMVMDKDLKIDISYYDIQ